jgi:hypothetical protein
MHNIEIHLINNEYWLTVTGSFNGQSLLHSHYQLVNGNTIQIALDIEPWPEGVIHIASMTNFKQNCNLKSLHSGNYTVVLYNESRTFTI